MILFTSAINQNKKIYPIGESLAVRDSAPINAASLYRRTARTYLGVTLFSIVFCLIYERFSFGESSDFMRMMFLAPLVLGVLPFNLLALRSQALPFSRQACLLWHSGVAILMSGCLIRGIIEISGRVSDYDLFYWIAAAVFLIAAFIRQFTMRNS